MLPSADFTLHTLECTIDVLHSLWCVFCYSTTSRTRNAVRLPHPGRDLPQVSYDEQLRAEKAVSR